VEIIIAEFFGNPFKVTLTEKDESYYIGHLKWDNENRKRFYEIQKANEEKLDSWYLDNEGNRLNNGELFAKSPWTIIENGIAKKAVKRYQDGITGEIRFAIQPWIRIGDEFTII